MKAVIYARYSSDSQREESIEGQIRECSDYAERNGITILAHYIDRALSARTADRPEFQRMIADSETQIFDLVLVWKLDRFSRDRYDSAHYKRILKKNGVRVISVKENISEGPEGIILESMLEGYAEYYSAELSQKIQRGQHENAMKCKSNGGNIPFGLMVGENGALMMNPVTAPVVQEIYEMYDNGSTMTEIRDWLNGQGIKTNRGKNFTVGGVSVILKNRRYIGEYRYGDIVIPNGIPPIIDADLFERIQRRLAGNKKAPARAKAAEEYLLTTKLFCGKCGRMMAGESGTNGKGMTYHYYKCSGAKRKLGCNKKAVKKHWIEKVAVRLTVQRVFHEEEINRLADTLVELQFRDNNVLPALKNQLKECERGIDNILNAIQMGIITSSTKERLESLENQKKELLASIAQIELERPVYNKEAIIKFIYQFKGGDMDDPEYQKQIIDIFLNSIYVYDDKLVFTYNFKEGTETISLAEIEAALCSDLTCLAPPNKKDHLSGWSFLFGGVGLEPIRHDRTCSIFSGNRIRQNLLCKRAMLMKKGEIHMKKWKRVMKRWIRTLCMAAVVHALVVPVCADQGLAGAGNCQVQPHSHEACCFDENGEMKCGYGDFFIHSHDGHCYDGKGDLLCVLPEIHAHIHGETCYSARMMGSGDEQILWKQVLVCTLPEIQPHVHQKHCFRDGGWVCGHLEILVHSHNDACFSANAVSAGDWLGAIEPNGFTIAGLLQIIMGLGLLYLQTLCRRKADMC